MTPWKCRPSVEQPIAGARRALAAAHLDRHERKRERRCRDDRRRRGRGAWRRRRRRRRGEKAATVATRERQRGEKANGRAEVSVRVGTPPGRVVGSVGSDLSSAMPVLRSRLDPGAARDTRQPRRDGALVADLRARQAASRPRCRRRRPLDRPPSRARQAAGPRADRPAARSRLGVPRAEPARGDRPVRRRRAGRRHRHRHRAGRGDDVRHRRQRRDGQGRHLLPDDGEEAPPGPGDRAREPAAVHLPRRQRRRVPAAPGRGLPRPRPFRADLLQPGPDVGRGHPPGRAGHGLLAPPAARTSRR